MLAIESGRAGAWLRQVGQSLPRPRAILILSPHWTTLGDGLQVQCNPHPATVHDYGGFPEEMYTIEYPAPGTPELAPQVVSLLLQQGLRAQINLTRGLDHGAWVPLLYLYPQADIPVLQLSYPSRMTPQEALRIGQSVAPLRHQGVLCIGSGSLTHNLRDALGLNGSDVDFSYVPAFSDWMADTLQRDDIDSLLAYRNQAPHALRAHPTDEHLLPVMFARGVAESTTEAVMRLQGDNISGLQMDSFLFGASVSLRATLEKARATVLLTPVGVRV